MTAEEFVKNFYLKRQSDLALYFNSENKTYVGKLLRSLNLDEKQFETMREIVNAILTDTYYSTLLGLDGAGSIGEIQEQFTISSEEGIEISENGSIEGSAYAYFHDNQFEINKAECDFIAVLNFLPTESGGRNNFALSGYRPAIKFEFSELQTSARQVYIDREKVFPGDIVEAEIKMVSADQFQGMLTRQMKFDFREGSSIIGTGVIKHVVDSKLQRAGR